MELFRRGLLEGRSIALYGAVLDEIRALLEALGARTTEPDPGAAADDERLSAWARAMAPLDVLICGESGERRVDEGGLLAGTWAAVRAVATEAFIPMGKGRIVLLAPRERRGIAAAALENLARTLSVEWARYGITATAIAPGRATTDDQLAELVCFLVSPAGDYFSGCRFSLGVAASAG